jgi:hypothetical protein
MTVEDPWVIAQNKVEALGPIPPVFSLAIRALMVDHSRDKGDVISQASHLLVSRLMLSPTMKAIIYHAVLTYHQDAVSNLPFITSWDLVRFFKPGDLASIIGATYFYAKIAGQLDSESIAILNEQISVDTDLGGHIGYCIPEISAGTGIFLGTFIILSQILASNNSHIYKRQSMQLYLDELLSLTPDEQQSEFGVSGLHVATAMLQKLGFGMTWTNGLIGVYSKLFENITSFDKLENLDVLGQKLLAGNIWMKCLRETNSAPNFKMPVEFYPNKAELHKLLYLSDSISRKGSKHNWLRRNRKDISPTLTPQLYQEYLIETAPSEELKRFCGQNMPDDIASDLLNVDLNNLTASILDEE